MSKNSNLRLVQTGEQAEHDGLLHLARNLNIHPDVLIGDGNAITGIGMPGSGKTTLLARLLEQFGACGIPFAVFDLEGDLAPIVPYLPRGVLATRENCPTVEQMYEQGLQVVFDIESFGPFAATLLVQMVNGLMTYVSRLPARPRTAQQEGRVPFLIGLDEAAYWLPQVRKGCDHLTPDELSALFKAFHQLAVRGRKMGLVPLLFSQRFATVHKDVLSSGTYFLMKQTLDADLNRYMEYISASAFGDEDLTVAQIKKRIATLKKGQAVVKLPSGKQGLVQFYNRESEHKSHAPKSDAAQAAYAGVTLSGSDSYSAFGEGHSPEITGGTVVAVPPKKEAMSAAPTMKEQVFALLDTDPTLSAPRLSTWLKCPLGTAQHYRTAYFVAYPQKAEERMKPTLKEQVFELLDKDPMLTAATLAHLLECSVHTIAGYRSMYFRVHPEKNGMRSAPTTKDQIFALLDTDPTLLATTLSDILSCPLSTAQFHRGAYFVAHPEKEDERLVPTMKDQVFALLDADPTLLPAQLAEETGCQFGTAKSLRSNYVLAHPEVRNVSSIPNLKEDVFALLDADPTLSARELASRTNNPKISTVQGYRSEYFANHPEKRPSRPMSKTEQAVRALLASNPALTVVELRRRTDANTSDILRILARIEEEKKHDH
jgi:hypothetical protein